MFSTEIRVFIEDTDVGGIVYHSNYLNYMERARSLFVEEISEGKGFSVDEIFVVIAVDEMKFMKPAKLLDRLTSRLEIIGVSPTRLEFLQEILRGDELLCKAKIKIACLSKKNFKPAKLPKYMLDFLEKNDMLCNN